MKLLIDQNMSPRLVQQLSDLYPDSVHVSMVGLDKALDTAVWDYALEHEYLIVTKDVDFSELGILFGFPPKVIWIRRGNCSTKTIEQILRDNFDAIQTLEQSPETGILTLF